MVDEHVLGVAVVDEVSIVLREILELLISRLDVDARVVSGVPQDFLDAERLMADGISIAQRREHLVHLASPTGWARHGYVLL